MAEIVLFPSMLGVRPAVRAAASRFEASGHVVHVVDLYGQGRCFDTYQAGSAYLAEIGGFPELITRTRAAVDHLPSGLVYAGFSAGGASAELLTLTRPGAQAVLLMHSSTRIQEFGVSGWPTGVPTQVHYAQHDQFRDQGAIDSIAASVRAAGASFELYEYPINGHLFTDTGLPEEYDATSTKLLYERATRFLAEADRRGTAQPSSHA
jgi:dienelactone hydrolase